jgi:hypothetical protein
MEFQQMATCDGDDGFRLDDNVRPPKTLGVQLSGNIVLIINHVALEESCLDAGASREQEKTQ